MHTRIQSDMLISQNSEPEDDIVARNNRFYVYLKPQGADDSAINRRGNFPGAPQSSSPSRLIERPKWRTGPRRTCWRRTRAAITARRPTNSIALRSSGRSVRWLSILRHSKKERKDEPGPRPARSHPYRPQALFQRQAMPSRACWILGRIRPREARADFQ